MSSLICPRCQTIKNMRETVSLRTVTGADGEKKEIETRSFHCASCSQFVKSEDRETSKRR